MKKETINQYFRGMFNYKAKNYQLDFAYDCVNKKRVVGVFCRQSGKTRTSSNIVILLARLKPNSKVFIFAPTERQTEHFAEYIKLSISQMPPTEFRCVRQLADRFFFSNGSEIRCLTAVIGGQGETIRGLTADVLVMEEAGSIKDYIIQSVILPMGATTDAITIKIGTSRGKNHFYESFKSPLYSVHCYDYTHPVKEGLITQAYIDEQKTMMTDIQFRTEYGAEFIEDQDAFFGYELIENCKDTTLTWDKYDVVKDEVYYLGADIARLGQDSTCLLVLAVKDNRARVVRIIDIPKSDLSFVIEKIEELIAFYKFKRVFLDETGLGAGVVDVLGKKYNQLRLQQGKQVIGFAKQTEYGDKIVGVKFTIQSKLDMFSNLKVIMSQGRLKYPNHPKLIAQLRDFRYELTENQNVKLHHSDQGFDDYCFVAGTKILTNKGQLNIENLKVGDLVLTRKGYKPIISVGNRVAGVITKMGLTGTPNHPIITKHGIETFNNVNVSHIAYIWNEKHKFIMECPITDTLIQKGVNLEYISGITSVGTNHQSHSIEKNGKIHTEKYPKDMQSIIKTTILPIIKLKTWKSSQGHNTNHNMQGHHQESKYPKIISVKLLSKQKNGTNQKQAESGIVPMHKNHLITNPDLNIYVFNAKKNIFQQERLKPNIAHMNAKKIILENRASLKSIVGNTEKKRVYNISVQDCNEYFANNILVHNCDALALACKEVNVRQIGYSF